jgi:redox-sensitive bicupin YhaK (pirin superfamily)
VYLDLRLNDGYSLELPALAPELAAYAVEGALLVDGQPVPSGQMVVLDAGKGVHLHARGATRLALVGGAPLDGPRHIWWNFVHSDASRIQSAAQDWEAGRFARIAGESEFIPLPPHRFVSPPPPAGSGSEPQYL